MQQKTSTTSGRCMPPAWRARLTQAARNCCLSQPVLQRAGNLPPSLPIDDQGFKTAPGRIERGLRRSGQRLLAGVALLLLLGQAPANAATITVGGQCTLTQAITAANTDGTAAGTCTRGLGPDTIVLPPNRPQVLTRVDNTTYGPTGLPVIRSDISIVGNGNIISRSAPARFRIFAVARTGRLTLSRLTLRGGFAPRHPRGSGGGGVRSVGVLNSTDVVFDRNQTDYGSGGGLWAQNVVNLVRNEFFGNRSSCTRLPGAPVCPATNGGGVAYAAGAAPATSLQPLPSLAITDSTFAGNIADDTGGGMVVSGTARINNSDFADNAAREGGAISVGASIAAVGVGLSRNVADNSATNYQVSAVNELSSITVTTCTLTDNVASESGGGLFVGGGSNLTLSNTVVSGNFAPRGREAVAQPGASVETDNANTIGFGTDAGIEGFTLGPSDNIAAQPPPDPTLVELPPALSVPDLPPEEPPLPLPTDPGIVPPDPGIVPPDPGIVPPVPVTPDDGTPDDGTPDDGTPDDGTLDGGTPDGGTPDGGTPDGGTPDGGTPDGGEPQ